MGRLTAGDIPGYAEALAVEQQNRENAYIGVPFVAGGVRLRQMTPRMLAILYAHGSPFVCGGSPSLETIIQFLWACSADFKESRFSRWKFTRRIAKRIKSGDFNFHAAIDDIDEYVEATFQDAPRGGGKSIPYVSQIAWIEFTMSGSPWNWTQERILNAPLRIIYQQMRCKEMSQGTAPINPSDRVRAEWLDSINNRKTGDS